MQRRSGFTLVELLVVMVLMLVLATLAVAYLPNVLEEDRAARGATMLQGWLNIARYKAVRDQSPRGVRFFVDPVSKFAARASYIEQPEDFAGGAVVLSTSADNVNSVNFTPDITGGNTDPNYFYFQQGDYLEIMGGGLLHRIDGIAPDGKSASFAVSTIPFKITTTNFRVIRQPRLTGEENLDMPDHVVVDMNTNATFGNAVPFSSATSVDVIFSPSGVVITPNVTTDTLNFWVRDTTNDKSPVNPRDGNPTIIAVNVRSGLVAGHPPAPTGDPYTFIVDGRSSGK